jgi:hypothetical protein
MDVSLQSVNLLKPSSLRTSRFNIKKFYVVLTLLLCVVCWSPNKLQLLLYAGLTDWFLYNRVGGCLLRGTHRALI